LEFLLVPYRKVFSAIVELRGNVVNIDGSQFGVNSKAIIRKNRFLFNRYERTQRDALAKYLDPSLPIVEFGAGIGVVSCVANKRLKDPTRHIAIEANPDLLALLVENRNRNGCLFTVLNQAVAYGRDEVFLYRSPNFTSSSIYESPIFR
jgi:Met-10+ like-protein